MKRMIKAAEDYTRLVNRELPSRAELKDMLSKVQDLMAYIEGIDNQAYKTLQCEHLYEELEDYENTLGTLNEMIDIQEEM